MSRFSMSRFSSPSLLVFMTVFACVGAFPAAAGQAIAASQGPIQLAQNYEQPPAVIPGEGPPQSYGQPQPQAQDAAGLLIRVDRLENQVRDLTGQIQELQFNQHRLEDELKKFQQDVDFRFQDSEGSHGKTPARAPGKRSDAGDPSNGGLAASSPPDASSQSPRSSRDDAFDPALDPNARGAPRVLGTLPPNGEGAGAGVASSSAPGQSMAARDGNGDAPLDLGDGVAPSSGPDASASPDASIGPDAGPPPARNNRVRPDGTLMAGLPPADTRADFDLALVSFNNGQFGAAETGFRGFLDRHPKDRLAPEAVFYLGESYWKRGRTREAAEQYLKVSTDYAKSPRAPESLLKLGLSLEKLGSREQACASWGEIARKYPNAPAAIRASASRDSKRDQC